MVPANVALLYGMVMFLVAQAHGFTLPSPMGAASGASRIVPVSPPAHDSVSVDVVIRIPPGTFCVGLPMVIPSKYMETKENFGMSKPLVEMTNDEYEMELETESTVVTLMFLMLPKLKTLLTAFDRGPSVNRNGGKLTVIVEPEGKSLWGTNDSVICT